jgi:hypothetical protein
VGEVKMSELEDKVKYLARALIEKEKFGQICPATMAVLEVIAK